MKCWVEFFYLNDAFTYVIDCTNVAMIQKGGLQSYVRWKCSETKRKVSFY